MRSHYFLSFCFVSWTKITLYVGLPLSLYNYGVDAPTCQQPRPSLHFVNVRASSMKPNKLGREISLLVFKSPFLMRSWSVTDLNKDSHFTCNNVRVPQKILKISPICVYIWNLSTHARTPYFSLIFFYSSLHR